MQKFRSKANSNFSTNDISTQRLKNLQNTKDQNLNTSTITPQQYAALSRTKPRRYLKHFTFVAVLSVPIIYFLTVESSSLNAEGYTIFHSVS